MSRTFQDLLAQRRQADFVARESELKFFRENLSLGLDDERRRFVINVYGQGGVGKSSLLRVYRKHAEKANWATAWSDQGHEELPEIIHRLASELGAENQHFEELLKRCERYRKNRSELEADPDYVEGFAGWAGGFLARSSVLMARRTPVAGAVLDAVDLDSVGDRGRELGAFLARKFKNDKADIELMRDPVSVLTPLFAESLSELAQSRRLALFFDEFERSSDVLDSWLRGLLEGKFGNVPADLILVIAGRNSLDSNSWAPFEALIQRISLEPFEETEAKGFLARRGISDPNVVELILKLSGRLPLLLATLAAGEPTEIDAVAEANETAVNRFLSWVEDPVRRRIAVDAAIPRRIDRDLVAEILDCDGSQGDPDRLFAWLVKMPFLLERSTGWSYHDVVRQQMVRYGARRTPERWRQQHERLAEAFTRRREAQALEESGRGVDSRSLSFSLEIVYHGLCLRSQPISSAISPFLKALEANRLETAGLWARMVFEAGEDSESDSLRTLGDDLLAVSGKDKDDEAAVEALGRIIESSSLPLGDQVTALWILTILHCGINHLRAAVSDLERLLEVTQDLDLGSTEEQKSALALVSRGGLLIQLNENDEAIESCEQVEQRFGHRDEIQLVEQVAKALVNKGVALESMKQTEEAIRTYEQVDERFGHRDEIQLAEPVARALVIKGVALGSLDQNEDAIQTYDQVDERFGHRDEIQLAEWVARALVNKCAALRLLNQTEEAIRTCERVDKRFSQRDEVQLAEPVARALVIKGVALRSLDQIGDAIQTYEQVDERFGHRGEIQLAEWVAKALVNKGVALRSLNQTEEAIQAYEQVDEKFGQRDEIQVAEPVARALFHKCAALGSLDQIEDAIQTYEQVDERFGHRGEIQLAEWVAKALVAKGVALRSRDQAEDAIQTYEQVDERFGQREEIQLVEQVAKALINKGAVLGSLEQTEAAIRTYEQVQERFGEREEIQLAERVAWALVNKGVALWSLEQTEAAIRTYEQVEERFGEREEIQLAEQVAGALNNRASAFLTLGASLAPRTLEQRATWDRAEAALVKLSQSSDIPLSQIYNYACLLALKEQNTEALMSLESCLEAGSISIEHVRQDSDWDAFKSEPDFLRLLDRYPDAEEEAAAEPDGAPVE